MWKPFVIWIVLNSAPTFLFLLGLDYLFLMKTLKSHTLTFFHMLFLLQLVRYKRGRQFTYLIFFFLLRSNLAIRNCLIRNLLVLRNHFLWPNASLLHKDKEHLALRNNFVGDRKVPYCQVWLYSHFGNEFVVGLIILHNVFFLNDYYKIPLSFSDILDLNYA